MIRKHRVGFPTFDMGMITSLAEQLNLQGKTAQKICEREWQLAMKVLRTRIDMIKEDAADKSCGEAKRVT